MDAPRRGRILAIDDEPMVLRIVQRTLAAEHEVVVTTAPHQALHSLGTGQRFDVILCDLLMPAMTGMDFHARLLRLVPDQAQKVVFFTAAAGFRHVQAFLEKIPNDRLHKPIEPATLRTFVSDRLRQ
jgi:CheY-like chemotaxis protein